MTEPNIKVSLRYEFDQRPAAGDTMQVAPGVHWLRMPLPIALGHINLWLLEDGDSWTIVDTGVDVEESETIWEKTFEEAMGGRPVNRVVVTHLHPDHVGCAGILCNKTGADLWMPREEYLLCRILVADTGRMAPDAGKSFYTAAGFAPDALHHYEKMFGFFGKFVSPLPESYHRLAAGDKITIGHNRWKIIIGRGHSPEHACLLRRSKPLDFRRPASANNLIKRKRIPHRTAGESPAWMDDLASGSKKHGA